MTTVLRVFAFGLTLSLISGLATAATLKKSSVGNWSVGSYSSDDTGQFNHCAATASYRNGVALVFAINSKYRWSVGFANDAWHLKTGTRYPVSLRVDTGIIMKETAVGVLPTFAEVQLADNTALFDAFKFGNQLTVYAAGQTFRFNLTDTSTLLPTLLSCVKSYEGQPQTASNPFNVNEEPQAAPKPSEASPAPATASDSERRVEATSLVANILARSGVSGFEIMAPEDAQKFKSDAAWRAGQAFGTMNIIVDTNSKPEDLNAALLASDSKACHDQFMSGSMPDASGTRLFTSCKSDKQTLTIYYSTIKRPKGGYYILATGGFEQPGKSISDAPGAPRSTQDVDSGIREAAFKVVAR